MLVSIAAYAWIWGLPFAIGFVAPDLRPRARARHRAPAAGRARERAALHPLPGRGHRDEGAPRRRLEGGARRARRADPRLASARPSCWVAGAATDSELLLALAFVGFFLNLFNLIPIVPARRRPRGRRAAPGVLVPRAAADGRARRRQPEPAAVVIVILGGLDLWRRWRERGQAVEYYRLPTWQRVTRRRRLPRPRGRARARDVGDATSSASSSWRTEQLDRRLLRRDRGRRSPPTSRSSPPSSSPASRP